MGKLGFYLEQEKCWGCRSCEVACKDVNDLSVGQAYRQVRTFEYGTYPNASMLHYSASCNHCDSPACVANCPTGAMYKCSDGTVQHDDESCIGCDTCVHSCPYEVPVHLDDKGIVGKCDSCYSLRARGQQPSCVASCVGRALHFGDLDELKLEFGSDGVTDQLPYLPESDTMPSLAVRPVQTPQSVEFRMKSI